ncbi:DUF4280 domain-containing protein [Robbsia sp. KACC 23696]|uniref:DUF4280 domain-containing protein n=1 Tax=Robbsia sp. KACC 23696 TaxID=3149231 RepID=UPI00325AA625
MPILVTSGAMLQCSFGAAPGAMTVLPANAILCGAPAANIMDVVPMLNIPSFGTCMCPANPMVAAATAAALGVLTPMPCIPATAAPWAPGSATVMLAKFPALQTASKAMCSYGGVIQVMAPSQFTTMVA